MRLLSTKSVTAFSFVLALTVPMIAGGQERIGTSCADCPNYSGSFSIENETGVMIPYQVRWGDSNAWKSIDLASGRIETHRYPLGSNANGRAPSPHIRYDRIGGDGKYTPQEYHMQFYVTGYAGFGPAKNNSEPKKYFFRYAADRKTLELLAR